MFGVLETGWPSDFNRARLFYFFETEVPVSNIRFPGGTIERGQVGLFQSVQWMEFENLDKEIQDFDSEYMKLLQAVGYKGEEIEIARSRSRYLLDQAKRDVLKPRFAGRFRTRDTILMADGAHRLVATVIVGKVESVRMLVVL